MVMTPRQHSPWDGSEKCAGMVPAGPDIFFEGPEDEAVELCRGGTPCAKMHDCLVFALLNNERIGVWGGHGEADRRAIRKQYPLRRGKIPRPEWRVFEAGEPASWFAEEELGENYDG